MANPVVFLDIAVDGQALGRITFELFAVYHSHLFKIDQRKIRRKGECGEG